MPTGQNRYLAESRRITQFSCPNLSESSAPSLGAETAGLTVSKYAFSIRLRQLYMSVESATSHGVSEKSRQESWHMRPPLYSTEICGPIVLCLSRKLKSG